MGPSFLPRIVLCALLMGFIGIAQAQSFVEFVGSSRLVARAETYGSQKDFDSDLRPLYPDIKNESSLRSMGVEQGACGTPAQLGQSAVDTSAQLNTTATRFELEMATALNVQGGFAGAGREQQVPQGPKICIPGPSLETIARAAATSTAVIEIKFNENAATGNYWLDLAFASKNSGAGREIQLRGPDGQVIRPVSDEPLLLQVTPNTSWYLEAAFSNQASDAGKCCGKAQQASLQVSGSVRPAETIFEQDASGKQPDMAGHFDAVGLLVTRNVKGEPVPVCMATVVGRRSVLTAAHCLSRFSVDKASPERSLWFVQNSNVQAGLRRGLIKVVGWSALVDPLLLEKSRFGELRITDKPAPYSHSREDLAVVYVDSDLGTRASLQDGDGKLSRGLLKLKSTATLVSYGPSMGSGVERPTAAFWVRNLVDVTVSSNTPPDYMEVRALQPQCGTDEGAPVFVESDGARLLVGIVVSGAKDCQRKVGPRLEGHMRWLRAEIDKRRMQ